MRDETEQHCPDSTDAPAIRTRREALQKAIAQEKVALANLETEQADSQRRLAALQAELASLPTDPDSYVTTTLPTGVPIPRTPADKVRLFRSLFRRREDVFPTRFESAKTRKSGYAPACQNKFVRGVCELPRIKCGECPNQAFIPFGDAPVIGHLTGRHVMMGVLP
jgi:hypothetical protein